MKPAPFEYYAPSSVDEALDLLAEHGYDVKILAGGQSLVPSMNFRLAVPPAILDLNFIPELSYIRPTDEGGVVIGTMTRDVDVEYDEYVYEHFPVIREAMHFVAHPQIRNRGTFGGAIAHADPTAQMPAVVVALKGQMLIRSKSGERWVPCDEFFMGPFTTSLNYDEMLVEVALPPMAPRSGASYQQMERQAGAQALVGGVAAVSLDQDGNAQDVRLVLCSVGEIPTLAVKAAEVLIGKKPTPELIAEAAAVAAAEDVDPGGDIHCSVEFRRHLVEVISRRALSQAFERAHNEGASHD